MWVNTDILVGIEFDPKQVHDALTFTQVPRILLVCLLERHFIIMTFGGVTVINTDFPNKPAFKTWFKFKLPFLTQLLNEVGIWI